MWRMASTLRMWERNLLPSPSPFDAPRTSPAMSTSRSIAETIFSVAMYLLIVASRPSGTATTPTFGSMVANG